MVLLSKNQYRAIMTELRDARVAHNALQEMVAVQSGRIAKTLDEMDLLHKRLSFERRPEIKQ